MARDWNHESLKYRFTEDWRTKRKSLRVGDSSWQTKFIQQCAEMGMISKKCYNNVKMPKFWPTPMKWRVNKSMIVSTVLSALHGSTCFSSTSMS